VHLNPKIVSQFKRDFKKFKYNDSVIEELEKIIEFLTTGKKIPEKYKDHSLIGGYSGMRECHIKPDVLLIYWIDRANNLLYLERIGSHSELFQ
jgi:mRNA interferase YafQ